MGIKIVDSRMSAPKKTLRVVFKGILTPPQQEAFVSGMPPGIILSFIERNMTAEAEIQQICEADMLVIHKARYGLPAHQLIENAKDLRLLQTLSQGLEDIPVQSAAEKGIPTSYAGGFTATSIAEHAVMLMLAALKRLKPAMAMLREDRRDEEPDASNMHCLHDKTVGIIGFGNSGRKVARMMRGFGARVVFCNRSAIPDAVTAEYEARQVSLEILLKTSDIVTIHLPLTESTRGMIGREQLGMMKPTAIMVNISRGTILDEAALVQALREGRIAGAGLDVFSDEPVSPDNPLLQMENVVATPHIAAEVWENYLGLFEMVWDNAVRLRDGRKIRNLVNEYTP